MADDFEPRHRIGAVVRLTGLSAHALRSWERRYGILSPERTEAGDRLYSESDVRRLRLFKRLTDYGHSIGDIARLDVPAIEKLLDEHTRPPEPRSGGAAHHTVERTLDALAALDLESAGRGLQRAAVTSEPRDFIRNVAAPLLRAIGQSWQAGALSVAHEHAASALLRTQFGALLAALPVEPKAPSLVSATLAGERHEFGALFAAITGGLAGWRPIYLGPDLPAADIASAARAVGARAVLISIVASPARRARAELDALLEALPARVQLIAGGRASEPAVKNLSRVVHGADLDALGDALAVPR